MIRAAHEQQSRRERIRQREELRELEQQRHAKRAGRVRGLAQIVDAALVVVLGRLRRHRRYGDDPVGAQPLRELALPLQIVEVLRPVRARLDDADLIAAGGRLHAEIIEEPARRRGRFLLGELARLGKDDFDRADARLRVALDEVRKSNVLDDTWCMQTNGRAPDRAAGCGARAASPSSGAPAGERDDSRRFMMSSSAAGAVVRARSAAAASPRRRRRAAAASAISAR